MEMFDPTMKMKVSVASNFSSCYVNVGCELLELVCVLHLILIDLLHGRRICCTKGFQSCLIQTKPLKKNTVQKLPLDVKPAAMKGPM